MTAPDRYPEAIVIISDPPGSVAPEPDPGPSLATAAWGALLGAVLVGLVWGVTAWL